MEAICGKIETWVKRKLDNPFLGEDTRTLLNELLSYIGDLQAVPGLFHRVSAFVDGACVPNPGMMGIGIVFDLATEQGQQTATIGKCLGAGTNNRAELFAVLYALRELKKKRNPKLTILTIKLDSEYTLNICTRKSVPSVNLDIVGDIFKEIDTYRQVIFIKALGKDNPADNLAKTASKGLSWNGWETK